MENKSIFQDLTPDIIMSAVETHFNIKCNGSITPYNSYINRVYGVQDEENVRYIVKFYRPGRWSYKAIKDEHLFVKQCEENDIPVITPFTLTNKDTIGEVNNIYFALFPLRGGRTFDLTNDQDWVRLGSIIGRMHLIGKKAKAADRIVLNPQALAQQYHSQLLQANLISPSCKDEFAGIFNQTIDIISPLFESVEMFRIHGDCHRGNILDRLDQGLLLIDFDDMMTGPAIQDLWLLLPGHHNESRIEMELLLSGYTQFIDFNYKNLHLIEPLRFLRIIYFLTWCAVQRNDQRFKHNFPDWGTEAFWIKEIEDIKYQLLKIIEHLNDDTLLMPG
ncbi:MAG: serine/threonine protein kinase [Spirochaetales bacterium]|nr:serine/threonine protein kinase [Spirochaetales bacterium]